MLDKFWMTYTYHLFPYAKLGLTLVKVGVVYFSKTDITGELVRAAAAGAEKAGAEVFHCRIKGPDIIEGRYTRTEVFQELRKCDGIIFASPTYMGGAAAQFKAFADATSEFWAEQEWAGKMAAGITSGTGLNGDQSSTLQYFATLASQHGMIWVGIGSAYGIENTRINALGCQLGVVAHSKHAELSYSDIETARYLGFRVSEIASKFTKPQ